MRNHLNAIRTDAISLFNTLLDSFISEKKRTQEILRITEQFLNDEVKK